MGASIAWDDASRAAWLTRRRWLLTLQASIGSAVGLTALIGLLPVVSRMAMPLVEGLILLGPLVAAPLALEATCRGPLGSAERLLIAAGQRLQPLAAACLLLAVTRPIGDVSGWLCVPWMITSGVFLLLGLARLRRRWPGGRALDPGELAIDVGLAYLPVGAVWLAASRLGLEPLGFGAQITTLTAAHFHFAGLAAPVIAGQLCRLTAAQGGPGAPLVLGAASVAATPVLIGIGITASPELEVATALLLALGVALVAIVYVSWLPTLLRAHPAGERWALLTLAPALLISLATMTLAALYAIGEYRGEAWISIPLMALSHGLVNVLGFALPSLALLTVLGPGERSEPV